MLCDICKKNEATIHIQEISGNQRKTLNLCSACAAERQKNGDVSLSPLNLANIIRRMVEESDDVAPAAEKHSLKCPNCDWEEDDFMVSSDVGCPECYKVFEPTLNNIMSNIQAGDTHIGKSPANRNAAKINIQRQIAALQNRMQKAIDSEDFEQAAVLRDRINELQKAVQS